MPRDGGSGGDAHVLSLSRARLVLGGGGKETEGFQSLRVCKGRVVEWTKHFAKLKNEIVKDEHNSTAS